jgi:branched-chain amino acid aminotransferase
MQRFLESIHILGIRDFPFTVEDLRQAVFQTIQANHFTTCYIRPLMYLEGPLGLNIDNSKPKVGIAAWEWGPYLGEESKVNGINMMVASYTRLHPNISMTKAKVTGNYANSMLVKTLALRSGYDEAVILDPNGFVAECTGENLFMIRRGVLYTPLLATVLEGITRDSVLRLAEDMGLTTQEVMITRDQLYIAEEVFITGTAAEIVGARAIDTRIIGDGRPGPITRSLTEAFEANLHGKGKFSGQWLEYLE